MSKPIHPQTEPVVVLVEDDPSLLAAMRFCLETDGFVVHAHSNAQSALRAPLPDRGCLVIDYFLPDMDGLALLERLRACDVEMPAALITSHPTLAVRTRAAEAGVKIIEKPLQQDDLVENVRSMLGIG